MCQVVAVVDDVAVAGVISVITIAMLIIIIF